MAKNDYDYEINNVMISTKWKEKHWGDFVLIGISKFWFSPTEYEWRFSLFGFDLRIWIKRILK